MGIDIYLKWDGMTEADKENQHTGFCTTAGHTGYLREAYHGGPYATKILVREAFEADNCEAEIPAAVMRERLTSITEPVIGRDHGHVVSAMFADMLRQSGHEIDTEVLSGITTPMSVENAVRTRYNTVYPGAAPNEVEEVVKSFRDFVALAEQKERETGKPCTVYASC